MGDLALEELLSLTNSVWEKREVPPGRETCCGDVNVKARNGSIKTGVIWAYSINSCITQDYGEKGHRPVGAFS